MLFRDFIGEFGERAFGLPPAALWGIYTGLRDRAELREGGFRRVYAGPGGGVRVTPFVAAHLLLGSLAGTTRTEAAGEVWRVAHLTGGCVTTGNALLGDALTDILAHPEMAEVVCEVLLFRTPAREARITWIGKRDPSVFMEDPNASERARCEGSFRTAASIGGATLSALAQALAAAAEAEAGQPAGRHRARHSLAVQRASSPREPTPTLTGKVR